MKLVNKVLKYLLACMLLTSFYTHTIDLESPNLILARMTFSDTFGVLAIVLFWLTQLKTKLVIFRNIHPLYISSVVLIATMFFSVITSLNVKATVFETLILVYLLVLSHVIYEVYKDNWNQLIDILVLTVFVIATTGLYGLVAANLDLPFIFEHTEKRHGVSGFRYFAQAGNYVFTMLTILTPYKYISLVNKDHQNYTRFFNITLVLAIIFMFTTGAIAVILSFLFSLFIFTILHFSKVKKDLMYLVGGLMTFLGVSYYYLQDFYQNIIFRIQSRVTDRQPDTPEASFVIQNFKDSIRAFLDNIFFGSGLGGFVNNYSKFEIHGTYLKILGETGIVGVVGYAIFLFLFIRTVNRMKQKTIVSYFIPFMIGSLLLWSYNYHLRKKEFWILVAFLLIVNKIKSTVAFEKD